MLTVAPIPPLPGERLVIPGPGVTVNVGVLLGPLLTVTTTGPLVAPSGKGKVILLEVQLVGVARKPLNVTVLEPCEEPKLEPLIVTRIPAGPVLGDRVLIFGAPVTVNLTPALA